MLIRTSRTMIRSRLARSNRAPVNLDRRGFLRYAAGSVVLLGAACDEIEKEAEPGAPAWPGGKADSVQFDENGVCLSGTTGTDALGPYWTSSIPQTNQLAPPDQPGQRLVVMGRVLARDCTTGIPGAIVAAWQADDAGFYDFNHAGLHQGATQGELTASQVNLRGWFSTSAMGTYALETILPAEYPLNLLDPVNSAFRAPHIHFAVFWTDGSGVAHQLVTQMYFTVNDLVLGEVPDLDQLNANDFGASTAEATRFATITGTEGGVWHGDFDIVLDVDPGSV
jgi:protocatechuate 3,4-dioxygenase beta subunit